MKFFRYHKSPSLFQAYVCVVGIMSSLYLLVAYVIETILVPQWTEFLLALFWILMTTLHISDIKVLKAFKYKYLSLGIANTLDSSTVSVLRKAFRKSIKTHKFVKIPKNMSKMPNGNIEINGIIYTLPKITMKTKHYCTECGLLYGNGYIDVAKEDVLLTCQDRKLQSLLL